MKIDTVFFLQPTWRLSLKLRRKKVKASEKRGQKKEGQRGSPKSFTHEIKKGHKISIL